MGVRRRRDLHLQCPMPALVGRRMGAIKARVCSLLGRGADHVGIERYLRGPRVIRDQSSVASRSSNASESCWRIPAFSTSRKPLPWSQGLRTIACSRFPGCTPSCLEERRSTSAPSAFCTSMLRCAGGSTLAADFALAGTGRSRRQSPHWLLPCGRHRPRRPRWRSRRP